MTTILMQLRFATVIILMAITGLSGQAVDRLYVGTFSERGSQGIYFFEFAAGTGEARLVQTIGGMESPSFLTLEPGGRALYAANRSSVVPGESWGSVSAFSIRSGDGRLTLLNERSSYGGGACHVQTDRSGQLVFVANYGGGSFSVYRAGLDGRLGDLVHTYRFSGRSIHPQRQGGSHVHACVVAPGNRHLFVTDLGTDRIYAYRIKGGKGGISPARVPETIVEAGAGPRHLDFDPGGSWLFLAEELGSAVSVYRYRRRSGKLDFVQRLSTLPAGFRGANTVADIHVHPNGRWLYVSNRGHDSLAIFAIDPATGQLKISGYQPTMGEHPRNFTIHPSGKWLLVANRDTDNITFFRLEPASGQLEYTGQQLRVPAPVCLVWGSEAASKVE